MASKIGFVDKRSRVFAFVRAAMARLNNRLARVMTAACCAVFIASCTAGDINEAKRERISAGRIVFGLGWEPVGFYPFRALDSASYYGQTLVYEGLVKYDASMNVVPAIAERFDVSQDGLHYHFHLRDGVQFCDGQPVLKDDVESSIKTAMLPASPFRLDYDCIKSTEWQNERDLTINLSHASAPLMSRLVELRIMPARFLASHDRGKAVLSRNPVGSGPFRLKNWESGLELVFEPNEHYWGEKPKCKQLVWRVVADKCLLVVALWRGEVDVAVVDPMSWNSVIKSLGKSAAPLVLDAFRGSRTVYLGFNLARPPFDNAKVRQAISMGINREQIASGLFGGFARVPQTDVSEGSWVYNPNAKQWPFDPDKARATLKEAGFTQDGKQWKGKDGKPLAFRILTVADYRDVAQVVSDDLARMMIPNEVQIVEYSTVRQRYLQKGDFDVVIWSRSCGPDPECAIVWGSQGSMNFSRFKDARVDELIESGRTAWTKEERANDYKEIQSILADQVPWDFLVQPELLLAHQSNIVNTKQAHQNLTGLPWDNPLFNAADWQRLSSD